MEFVSMEHDVGDLYKGSENPYMFRFKTYGDVPLVIESTNGCCGCAVPIHAKDPIMPGEENKTMWCTGLASKRASRPGP